MICTHVRVKEEGRGFNASNLGVWFCLRADPRKLKREKVQNLTSAKIATLENFPLYGISCTDSEENWSIPHVQGMYMVVCI